MSLDFDHFLPLFWGKRSFGLVKNCHVPNDLGWNRLLLVSVLMSLCLGLPSAEISENRASVWPCGKGLFCPNLPFSCNFIMHSNQHLVFTHIANLIWIFPYRGFSLKCWSNVTSLTKTYCSWFTEIAGVWALSYYWCCHSSWSWFYCNSSGCLHPLGQLISTAFSIFLV